MDQSHWSLRQISDALDTDGRRKLTRHHFAHLMREVQGAHAWPDAEVNVIFDYWSGNKDDEVDVDEFTSWLFKRCGDSSVNSCGDTVPVPSATRTTATPQTFAGKPEDMISAVSAAACEILAQVGGDAPAVAVRRPPELSGITLSQLKELRDENFDWISRPAWNEHVQANKKPSMYDVVPKLVKPATAARKCAYVQLFPEQKAEVFVSHWWGEEYINFVASLAHFAQHYVVNIVHEHLDYCPPNAEELADAVVFWVCSFANNQWEVNLGGGLAESPFELALSAPWCKAVVMVLDEQATPLTRIWCIYEVLRSHMIGLDFHMASKNGLLSDYFWNSEEDFTGEDCRGEDMLRLCGKICSLDPCAAQASVESDRQLILAAVDEAVGYEQLRLAVQSKLASFFSEVLGDCPEVGRRVPKLTETITNTSELTDMIVCFDGRTPLHAAAQRGDMDMLESLIKQRASVNDQDAKHHTALHMAAFFSGNMKIIDKLLECNSDATACSLHGCSAMYLAAVSGHTEAAARFLDLKCDVARKLGANESALHWAARNGHASMVALLVERRCDIMHRTTSGHLPLHWAAMADQALAASKLIELRSSVAGKDNEGMNALHLASCLGSNSVVEVLGTHIQLLDSVGPEGMRPLHMAASTMQALTIELLLKYRADVEMKSSDGQTATEILEEIGSQDVAASLELLRSEAARQYTEGYLPQKPRPPDMAFFLADIHARIDAGDDFGEFGDGSDPSSFLDSLPELVEMWLGEHGYRGVNSIMLMLRQSGHDASLAEAFDANDDGFIDPYEFLHLCQHVFVHAPEARSYFHFPSKLPSNFPHFWGEILTEA